MATLKHHRPFPRSWPRTVPLPVVSSGWIVLAAMLAVAAAALWLDHSQFSTPATVPASAPTTQFSAERAAQHLQVIAREPRPAGSAANAAVQQYLVGQLTAMGLQPEVQTTTASEAKPEMESVWAGTVHNIVARIPGTANTKALLLGAHYDSVPSGPGAADCGSCIATLLETVRALRSGPPLKNDVIVVFQDAEEHDMLGSRAFVDEHPWAGDVGLALNFEAQGSSGPSLMYVTGDRNGPLMDGFLKVAPHPFAYSFFIDLRDPFGLAMDLGNFMERGAAGFGFAFFGDAHTYHTSTDDRNDLQLSSLQHDGSYALALARAFGNRDLRPERLKGQNAVFFNVAGGLVAHYPGALVVPLALVVTVLFAAMLVTGVRRRQLSIRGTALGAGAFFAGVIGAVILATAVWWLIRKLDPDLHILLVGVYQSDLFLFGLVALTVALLPAVALALRGRVDARNLTAGALLWWLLLLWLTALALPGFSYLFTWPLLAALLVLGWAILRPPQQERPWVRVAAGSLLLVPSLLLFVPAVELIGVLAGRGEGPLGVPLMGVPVLFAGLAVGVLLPLALQVPGRRGWVMPAVAGVAAVVLLGVAVQRSGFSSSQPKPTMMAYRLSADTGTATWLTANDSRWSGDRAGALDAWTKQFFTAGAQKTTLTLFPSEMPTTAFAAYQAQAPAIALPAPEAMLVADATSGEQRTLTFSITSPRHALNLQALIRARGTIEAAAVNGKPLDLTGVPAGKRDQLRLQYYGVPEQGIELALVVQSGGPVTVALEDRSYGLPEVPGMAIAPRPANMMTAMTEMTDSTTVSKSFVFDR